MRRRVDRVLRDLGECFGGPGRASPAFRLGFLSCGQSVTENGRPKPFWIATPATRSVLYLRFRQSEAAAKTGK
jgi:hypothetical protein